LGDTLLGELLLVAVRPADARARRSAGSLGRAHRPPSAQHPDGWCATIGPVEECMESLWHAPHATATGRIPRLARPDGPPLDLWTVVNAVHRRAVADCRQGRGIGTMRMRSPHVLIERCAQAGPSLTGFGYSAGETSRDPSSPMGRVRAPTTG